MSEFYFRANVKQIADKLGETADNIAGRINNEVKGLSIGTHAFVVRFANDKLKGTRRNQFFGENNQNVRWVEVTSNVWVVEIDESVKWIEEGRQPTSMATDQWLLKGPGVKTAKDGSKYRVIPFSHKGKGSSKQNPPEINSMINKELRSKGINLSKIERDADNNPKLGVIHKLDFDKKRSTYPERFFSEPRSREKAKQLGLSPSHGNHFLKNAVVIQREVKTKSGRTKISKDVVTFRVVSSKHEAEGRWMYPQVEALGSIPEAWKWAQGEWDNIVNLLEKEFRSKGE